MTDYPSPEERLVALTDKITPRNSTFPKFVATVTATLAPFAAATYVVQGLPAQFDIDTAIGAQLDIVGEWVGISRTVRIPLPGSYFSFDDPLRGWDIGVWKGAFDRAYGLSKLPDDVYRRLLYSNIAAKHWDGTVPGAQAVYDIFFTDPATHVFLQDNAQVPFPKTYFALDRDGQGWDQAVWYQDGADAASQSTVDVSMTVGVSGKIPTPAYLALLGQGAIPIKPGGVEVSYAVVSVDNTALFGFDLDNDYVAGWEEGSWGVTPDFLLTENN